MVSNFAISKFRYDTFCKKANKKVLISVRGSRRQVLSRRGPHIIRYHVILNVSQRTCLASNIVNIGIDFFYFNYFVIKTLK